jgi:hypothetical protein
VGTGFRKDHAQPKSLASASEREMRVAGVLFDVMEIVGDAVVLVNVANAVEMHFLAAGAAGHPVAVNDSAHPFMKHVPAFRAADPHLGVFDLFLMGIKHGYEPSMTGGSAKSIDKK